MSVFNNVESSDASILKEISTSLIRMGFHVYNVDMVIEKDKDKVFYRYLLETNKDVPYLLNLKATVDFVRTVMYLSEVKKNKITPLNKLPDKRMYRNDLYSIRVYDKKGNDFASREEQSSPGGKVLFSFIVNNSNSLKEIYEQIHKIENDVLQKTYREFVGINRILAGDSTKDDFPFLFYKDKQGFRTCDFVEED